MFSGILGHDGVLDALRRAQDGDRVAHAYLFAGPRGVGKQRVAMAFAQRLNCKDRAAGADACGQCRSCRQITAGTYPDFVSVVPDGQFIKIAQVREVTRSLRFPPLDAAVRVVLIEDADQLHEAAANALLKTLEEPAPRNIFLLLSAQPNAVLATIRSRCQMVRFTALSRGIVADWLVREKGLDEVTADEVAAMSDGSMSAAEALTNPTLGALREEWLRNLVELPRLAPSALMQLAESMSVDKETVPAVLDVFRVGLRDALLRAVGRPDEALTFRGRAPIAAHLDAETLVEALRLVQDAEAAHSRNVNPRMVAEHALLGLRALWGTP